LKRCQPAAMDASSPQQPRLPPWPEPAKECGGAPASPELPSANLSKGAAKRQDLPSKALKGVYETGSGSIYIQLRMHHEKPLRTLYVGGWHRREDAAIARDFAVLWHGMQQGRQLSELDLNLPLALYSGRQRLMAFLRRASFEELQRQVRAFARESMRGGVVVAAGAAAGAVQPGGSLEQAPVLKSQQAPELAPAPAWTGMEARAGPELAGHWDCDEDGEARCEAADG
jgi:hypothetical protein